MAGKEEGPSHGGEKEDAILWTQFGVTSDLLKKYGFKEEEMEVQTWVWGKTGYPEPVHRYRWELESYTDSIEETYFWILDFLREEWGYPYVHKITDVFTASENSAFFGVSQQRLGLQQDKVSQFLATIGKMIKDLFQLVRELRILDERLGYYRDSYDAKSRSRESAEITLKGVWIDLVEQGSKNPASVYGMARELGFTTLPDLFFATHPVMARDVDEEVDKLDFNRKIKEVLKRKLRTYLEWKESTFKELQTRKVFTLKYLRQHYDIIKLYIDWVKPYLRNIKRLQMHQGKFTAADLVVSFENSLIEIELLFKRPFGPWYSVVLVNFDFRTRPAMSFQQEGYNRGPLHVGKVCVTLRGYAWDDATIQKYIDMKNEESFNLLMAVDTSLEAAMTAMGTELMGYLREAGERFPGDEDKKKESKGNKLSAAKFADPFVSIFSGIKGSTKQEKHDKPKNPSKTKGKEYTEYKEAKKWAIETTWDCYKNYKKSHNLLNW